MSASRRLQSAALRKQRSFADDGKSVKSTPADRRGRQHEDGVMAYNGLAGIGRLTWKMDIYGSRRLRSRADTGACGGWERKATLFAKLSPESNRAYRVGRQALADFPNSVTLVRNRAVGRRE